MFNNVIEPRHAHTCHDRRHADNLIPVRNACTGGRRQRWYTHPTRGYFSLKLARNTEYKQHRRHPSIVCVARKPTPMPCIDNERKCKQAEREAPRVHSLDAHTRRLGGATVEIGLHVVADLARRRSEEKCGLPAVVPRVGRELDAQDRVRAHEVHRAGAQPVAQADGVVGGGVELLDVDGAADDEKDGEAVRRGERRHRGRRRGRQLDALEHKLVNLTRRGVAPHVRLGRERLRRVDEARRDVGVGEHLAERLDVLPPGVSPARTTLSLVAITSAQSPEMYACGSLAPMKSASPGWSST